MADDIKLIIKSILDDKDFQKGVSSMGKSLKTSQKEHEGFFKTIQNNWLKVATIVTGVVGTIKKAWDFTKTFAEYEQGMNALAKNTGQNANTIVERLKEVSKGTISNKDIMLAANRAVALGVTKDTEQMGQLMMIAKDRAKAMGITTTQAFNDIVTGIGRGSPMILDNLGIMIKGWNKMGGAQDGVSEKGKLLNMILKQYGSAAMESADRSISAAERMEQFNASWKNLELAIGNFLKSAGGQKIIKFFTDITKAVTDVVNGISNYFNTMDAMSKIKEQYNIRSQKELDLAMGLLGSQKAIDKALKTKGEDEYYINLLYKQREEQLKKLEKATGRTFSKEELLDLEKKIELMDKIDIGEITNNENIVASRQTEHDDFMAKSEEKKMTREEYLTYMDELRILDLEKEQASYEQALIYGIKYNQDLTAIEQQHAINKKAIEEKLYGEEAKMMADWKTAWSTAIGNVSSKYADGIAEMIWSGEVWHKTFGDFIEDMIIETGKLITKMLILKGIQTGLSAIGLGFLFSGGGVVPGMTRGGVVYANAGFTPQGTDTVPAMLTPGERVLSVDQNKAFENLIGSLRLGGGGENIVNNTTNSESQTIYNNFDNKFDNGGVDEMIRFSQRTGSRILRR